MAQTSLNRRLSTQDASFLYFEREEAPLHIGSIAVLEGDLSYERLLEAISNKLHLIPRYLQRAVPVPVIALSRQSRRSARRTRKH